MQFIVIRKKQGCTEQPALAEMSLESITLITLLTRLQLAWQACAIATRAEHAVLRVFQ